MSQADTPVSVVPLLSRALQRIRATPPRIIASPPTQPRRAAVALVIRVVPSPHSPPPPTPTTQPTLQQFFDLDWVKDPHAKPEILFLQRENPANNGDAPFSQGRVRHTTEAHVAFPGGRMEPDDEGGSYTAMRQTWEELGIDLAEKHYICIGQLDDREITTSLGKRLLMILSPFVFLQVAPSAPPADPVPTTQLHWTPLGSLISPNSKPQWSSVTVDAASRLTPKNSAILRVVVRLLVGTMQFPAIVIQPSKDENLSGEEGLVNEKQKSQQRESIAEKGTPPRRPQGAKQELKLWGLSLGMTLDLMSYMILPTAEEEANLSEYERKSRTGARKRGSRDGGAGNWSGSSGPSTPLSEVMQLPWADSASAQEFRMEYVAPSLASVFPRFSYPDVNFWIWVFGKRYREVVRGWEGSVRAGGTNDRRINWSGSALSTFYAAIRKALIVVIAARALGILFGLGFAAWWIFGQ